MPIKFILRLIEQKVLHLIDFQIESIGNEGEQVDMAFVEQGAFSPPLTWPCGNEKEI